MNKQRIIGLDVVRVIAILLVFSLHFMLRSGFFSHELYGGGMFLLTIYLWITLCCISLFLLLTGYFGYKASLTKKYFCKIGKILISYFLISILALVFRTVFIHEKISLIGGILRIFNFEADGYAWYVEMYIGLFILIPFLNIVYDNLKTKENRLCLIIIFLIITAVAPALRLFGTGTFAYDLLPNYWILLYPFTYFFIGRYLKDYPLCFPLYKKIIILASCLLVESFFSYFLNYGKMWPGLRYGFNEVGHLNLFTVIISVMIFEIFRYVNFKNVKFNKLISKISLVTFEMYLISWICDNTWYSAVHLSFNNFFEIFRNYFVYVGLVLISSFVLAVPVNKLSITLYSMIKPWLIKILNFISSKIKNVSNDL